jgi:hypothetical protein
VELNTIYRKTEKGELAIRHRTEELPNDLRMVLLLINGLRDIGTLRMVSEHCRDSIAPLIFLEDNGFIEMIAAQSNVVSMAGGARVTIPTPAVNYAPQPNPVSVQYAHAQVYTQNPPPSAQPTYAEPPAQQAPSNQIRDKVNSLMSYVSRALGEDAKMVYSKIEAIRTEQEFQDMVKKLYIIIGQYRGVKDAERFMSSFGQ